METLEAHRNILLREWTRHEGLKGSQPVDNELFPPCAGCTAATPDSPPSTPPPSVVLGSIQCLDCQQSGLRCAACIVKEHASLPLHRLQIYNGNFFETHTLYETGFVLQLGHDGDACPHPKVQGQPLIIIDATGIHRVRYSLCGCQIPGSHDPVVQLMRARLWPSTAKNPSTVVTFATLRLFHALAIQGKVNMYDFYQGIVRVTEGVVSIKVCTSYKAFLRCVRMFRHLRLAKRAGAAQKINGVYGMECGEAALRCPACPRPGVNLPDDWEDAPPEKQYLYTLMLAIDANFKLKMKDRDARNTYLGDGWAFFVSQAPYAHHLDNNTDMSETKHCESEHTALRSANMPSSKRWAVNGVGAVVCARHLLYFAQGIVDLPRGERFICMDYGVFSSLRITAKGLKRFLFSYDIACSWSVNFRQRLRDHYAEFAALPDDAVLTFVVPKFHLEAHGEDCKCAFNLNHTRGAGRTCGEGVETGWADMNAAGLFTREMGLAHRHEVLDDFMQAINWRKILITGSSLLKQLVESLPLALKQKATLTDLEATIPKAVIRRWLEQIQVWDEEPNKKGKPSPYRAPVISEYPQSLAAVKFELAQEEGAELEQGIALNEMSGSTYIGGVIALEDQGSNIQRKGQRTPSSEDKARLAVRQNEVHHRAQTYEAVQSSYALPPLKIESSSAAPKRARSGAQRSGGPVVLWLPSNVPASLRASLCLGNLTEKEIKYRMGVCKDTVHNIRRGVRQTHAFFIDSKRYGFMSQKTQTRSISARITVKDALARHVAKYRRSYSALCVLDPDNHYGWQHIIRKLENDDLRAPADEDSILDAAEESELAGADAKAKRKASTMSWIWLVDEVVARDVPGARTEEEAYDHIQIDWARQHSRALRWHEETEHVIEEMQRVVATHVYTANEWRARAESTEDLAAQEALTGVLPELNPFRVDIVSGLRAHALRQADVYLTLATDCLSRWLPFLRQYPEWQSLAWPEELQDVVTAVNESIDASEELAKTSVPPPPGAASASPSSAIPLEGEESDVDEEGEQDSGTRRAAIEWDSDDEFDLTRRLESDEEEDDL
ncbi:hypothetical protein PENSPDRAFT_595729 [Peniophora sp. CONT]|nr:hypothetical protein PENSPDRAFT_595729 [Peniophora sp. CONT]